MLEAFLCVSHFLGVCWVFAFQMNTRLSWRYLNSKAHIWRKFSWISTDWVENKQKMLGVFHFYHVISIHLLKRANQILIQNLFFLNIVKILLSLFYIWHIYRWSRYHARTNLKKCHIRVLILVFCNLHCPLFFPYFVS